MQTTNWAGNHTYRATRVHEPRSLDQLRAIVAATPRLRVLGSRHSFSDIADSDELLSLAALPRAFSIDHEAGTVSFNAGLTYGDLAPLLSEHGLALANLASLPHISVAGAVATATHGSGDALGNLATSVAAMTLVRSDGELMRVARGDPDFDGMVVGLGALGVVTALTLDVEPAFDVRQRVFEDLSWDALFDNFDAIFASGYSVSAFCRWGSAIDQVWIKSRTDGEPERMRAELFGARAATVERHPILELDAVNCTPQLGVAGPWSERMAHFRMGFTPSSGDEVQAEFHVARRDGVAAIRALRALSEMLAPLTLVTELRTVAADRLWLSPQYGRSTVAVHFTLRPQLGAVMAALVEVERVLAPFAPRPHWGKLLIAGAEELAQRYERWDDFTALVARMDARGAFRNAWLEQKVLGAAR